MEDNLVSIFLYYADEELNLGEEKGIKEKDRRKFLEKARKIK